MSPQGEALLPPFTEDGVLPPGDHVLTLEQLAESALVVGPGETQRHSEWDVDWRRQLVENLGVLVCQLWQVGVSRIFIDGSFVEDKDHPNDIDGYFECELERLASGELQRELNVLDPHKAWTWEPASRRPHRGHGKRQLPMWHVYRVELYPHFGQPSGLCDRYGHALEFPAAFRRRRGDGKPRGIIRIGATS
jgi:hypothetical protein